jgi:hypothetical protein
LPFHGALFQAPSTPGLRYTRSPSSYMDADGQRFGRSGLYRRPQPHGVPAPDSAKRGPRVRLAPGRELCPTLAGPPPLAHRCPPGSGRCPARQRPANPVPMQPPVTQRQSARNARSQQCWRTQERKKENAMQSSHQNTHETLAPPASPRQVGYRVSLARSEEEVREAQRLRYKVFVEELGAHVQTRLPGPRHRPLRSLLRPPDRARKRGRPHRRHLPHPVPGRRRRVGSYYSENEFHINRLQPPAQPHGGSRPLLHPSRPPQRRRDHPAVGRPGRLHGGATTTTT